MSRLWLPAVCLIAGCALYPPGMTGQLPPAGINPAFTSTYERVHGMPSRVSSHLAVERGNLWPGPPTQVPTSLTLLRQRDDSPQHADAGAAPNHLHHRGGYGLCAHAAAKSPPPGVALGLCYAAAR